MKTKFKVEDGDIISKSFQTLQNNIINEFLKYEETDFHIDTWKRPEGGGGRTCILSKGCTFDKVGVNFSDINGTSLPPAATSNRPELNGMKYRAMGVSVVTHPKNPFVPTVHLNVRFFMAFDENTEPLWWFGGGFDMTPFYPFLEDVVLWHESAQKICVLDKKNYYDDFKKQCDDYFYLKHRNEPRGVGGIFFDNLNNHKLADCHDFVIKVGECFYTTYSKILKKRKDLPYSEKHKSFQLFRRGRYVEFNLVYDRGTLFGLQSNGRTESILMSLPPSVNWIYNYPVEDGSEESVLYKDYLLAKDWLKEKN